MVDAYLTWGVAAAVIGLGLFAMAFMWRNRAGKGFSGDDTLQALGMTLVILGIVFGDDRLVGYSFIGVGVLLSAVSLVIRRRQGRT